MAGNQEKLLGVLSLDISQIKKNVEEVNGKLDGLSRGVKKAMGEAAQSSAQLESVLTKVSVVTKTFTKDNETATQKIVTGFDAAGNKVKEYLDELGKLSKIQVTEEPAKKLEQE